MKILDLKTRINKNNNQINVNIPKKLITKEEIDNIIKDKKVRILLK